MCRIRQNEERFFLAQKTYCLLTLEAIYRFGDKLVLKFIRIYIHETGFWVFLELDGIYCILFQSICFANSVHPIFYPTIFSKYDRLIWHLQILPGKWGLRY